MNQASRLAALLLVVLGASTAAAQITVSVSFNAQLATYIRSGSPANAYAGEDRMLVGNLTSNPAIGIIRGVIQFDLSSIPAGSTIESVSLKLIKDTTTAGYDGDAKDILVIDQGIPVFNGVQYYTNWSQVDWNKMGGGNLGGTVVASLPNTSRTAFRDGGFQTLVSTASFDDVVSTALTSQSGIVSLLLYSPDSEAISGAFWRVGADVTGEFPQLEVTYTAAIPEPGTVGLFAAVAVVGAAVLPRLRRRRS